MDYSSVKQILNDIESEIDVTEIKYKGKSIWPILKSYLFFGMLKSVSSAAKHTTTEYENTIYHPGILQKIKNNFSDFFNYIPYKVLSTLEIQKIKGLIKDKEILFLDVADELYIDEIESKKYSRYIIPYFEFIKERAGVVFLNISKKKSKHLKLHEPHYFNSSYFFSYAEVKKKYAKKIQKKSEGILNYGVLNNMITDKSYHKVVNESSLIYIMEEVCLYEELWMKILKDSKLKLVFFECFYGNQKHYGLLAACKQLNIKVIDIQHGIASDEMYQGWNKVPERGYSYLPDYYWCWSNYDVGLVKKSRVNSTELAPILGGNMWLRKNLSKTFVNEHDQAIEAIINVGKYERVMLVTLQYFIPTSQILLDTIKQAPKNWLWLVRFHPLDYNDPGYRNNYISELEKYPNVEFKHSTDANLYSLIKHSNVHLTHHSTSSVEAISFNVPTILLGNKFENIFKDYINSQIFFIAESSIDIIDYISNEKYKNFEEQYEYFKIDYSTTIPDKLLTKLLSSCVA